MATKLLVAYEPFCEHTKVSGVANVRVIAHEGGVSVDAVCKTCQATVSVPMTASNSLSFSLGDYEIIMNRMHWNEPVSRARRDEETQEAPPSDTHTPEPKKVTHSREVTAYDRELVRKYGIKLD